MDKIMWFFRSRYVVCAFCILLEFAQLLAVIIFPMIWGTDGVLWAGPIADGAAGIMGFLLVRHEMRKR